MFKKLFLISSAVSSLTAYSAPLIKVAVIDTGISKNQLHLCSTGHKDFTRTSLKSESDHGPNVSGLIDDQIKSNKYCQLILKFWDNSSEVSGTHASIEALKEAIAQRVDFINYSAGGKGFNADEYSLVKKALDMGIVVVVAAGNEGQDLDSKCDYFPACYDKRLIVVGNLSENGTLNPSSNYGSIVSEYIIGTNRCANSVCLTGTSQATAIMTGKLINKKLTALKKSK